MMTFTYLLLSLITFYPIAAQAQVAINASSTAVDGLHVFKPNTKNTSWLL